MILEHTLVLTVSDDLSGKDDIKNLEYAAEIIKKGGTVCFPTETVYGLGANALDENAVKSIFDAKGRPQDNPLIIHFDNIKNAEAYCFCDSNPFLDKVKQFMPGPITVVLEKRTCIPDMVTANLKSVGVRIPENKVANKFLELCGVPVAAPSANISGKPSPTCAKHVIDDLFGKVDVIISSGQTDVGLESTIVSLVTNPPMLLRPGAITLEQLGDALGEIDISSALFGELQPGDIASAPGMKYKHYAPKTPVYLVVGEDSKVTEFLKEKQKSEKCAVLVFSEDIPLVFSNLAYDMGERNNPKLHARRLFSALRETDKAEELEAVYVHITDDRSGLNLAVFNRLLKASAYHIISL